MTITRLHPVSTPTPAASNADRITAALNQAIEDHKIDVELGQSARGVAVLFFREYENGTFGESWIIQGLNSLEAVGLMHITAEDIGNYGLTGAPDHFPDGRPPLKDTTA